MYGRVSVTCILVTQKLKEGYAVRRSEMHLAWLIRQGSQVSLPIATNIGISVVRVYIHSEVINRS